MGLYCFIIQDCGFIVVTLFPVVIAYLSCCRPPVVVLTWSLLLCSTLPLKVVRQWWERLVSTSRRLGRVKPDGGNFLGPQG